jgi:hypothetical protein
VRFRSVEVEYDGEVFTVREMGALPRVRLFRDVGDDNDKALLALCDGLASCVYQDGKRIFDGAEAAGDIPQGLFNKLSDAWRNVNGVGEPDPNA